MFHLQTGNSTPAVIPAVKERIVDQQVKITSYLDRFKESVMDFLPKLAMAVIVLLIGLWVIKRVAVLVDKGMTRKELDISLRTFIRSLISIGLKIILIVTVVGMLGVGTTSFAAILGAAGLAVGLALQGSLSNFAGGVLLLIFKPFKVGDTIEAQGQVGDVKEIQIFNTILLTGDHKLVILPNGPLSNGTIVNRTRYGSLRIEISLAVSNSNNISRVKEIIHEVLAADPRIIKDPAPGIFIGRVSDGSVEISVKPVCLPGDTAQLTSDLYYKLYYAFEKNGVKLPPNLKLIHSTT